MQMNTKADSNDAPRERTEFNLLMDKADAYYSTAMANGGGCYRPTNGKEPRITWMLADFAMIHAQEIASTPSWRRVEDGLPDEDGIYVITTLYKPDGSLNVTTSGYNKKYGWAILATGKSNLNIIAWQKVEPFNDNER